MFSLQKMNGTCSQSCREKVFTQNFLIPTFQAVLLDLVICDGAQQLPPPIQPLGCTVFLSWSFPLLWCLELPALWVLLTLLISCGIPQCAAFTLCLVLHLADSFCAPWGCWKLFSPGRGWFCGIYAQTVMQQPRNHCIPSSVACSGCFITWGEWLMGSFPSFPGLCFSTGVIVVCYWKPQTVPQEDFLWFLAVCGVQEDAGSGRDGAVCAALRGCCPGTATATPGGCWHIHILSANSPFKPAASKTHHQKISKPCCCLPSLIF